MYFVPDLIKCQIQNEESKRNNVIYKARSSSFQQARDFVFEFWLRSRSSENASRREGEDIEDVQKAILQAWWMSLTEICLVKQLNLIW